MCNSDDNHVPASTPELGIAIEWLAQGDEVAFSIYRRLAAERSYDEALTLSGTELHIQSLRTFRERQRRLGGTR